MAAAQPPPCAVGDRVRSQGHTATVRFVGAVAGTKGEWIGLEWDDFSRGKHDGTNDGTRYFSVSHPTAGSFVRPRILDPWISFEDAVQERYGTQLDNSEETSTFLDGKQQAIKVELVGADKAFEAQRQFEKLRTLSVSGAAVRCASDPDALTSMFPSVTELDLSRTLVPNLASAVAITSRFASLSILRLCSMGWDPIIAEDVTTGTDGDGDGDGSQAANSESNATSITVMHGITELYFNLCLRSFPGGQAAPQVALIARVFPNLVELHLGGNGIITLSGKGGQCIFPQTLRHLNLEDNSISDWKEVQTLSAMPMLERLNLSKNSISEISGLLGDADAGHFASLAVLNISRNNLSSWSSINELRGMPVLTELHIIQNPVFDGQKGLHVRQCIISRLRKVQRLNRTDVGAQERVIAERFYLAQYSGAWWEAKEANSPDAMAAFEAEHPTFRDLIAAHGEPDRPKAAVVALKAGFVSLRAVNREGAPIPPIQLPRTTTVARLRQVLKAKKVLAQDNLTSATLTYVDDAPDVPPIELDDDLRELAFYNVHAGEVKLA